MHHCYSEIDVYEKWARRNFETIPNRQRLNTNVDDDDLVENQCTLYARPDGSKIAKQTKKNGGVGAYKEELIVLVEVKMALSADQKEEKVTFSII